MRLAAGGQSPAPSIPILFSIPSILDIIFHLDLYHSSDLEPTTETKWTKAWTTLSVPEAAATADPDEVLAEEETRVAQRPIPAGLLTRYDSASSLQ